jgi:hypothetical protein
MQNKIIKIEILHYRFSCLDHEQRKINNKHNRKHRDGKHTVRLGN